MVPEMSKHDTRECLLDAAEQVIRRAGRPEDVSVRKIVAAAETNVSSVSYHFVSLEGLAVACAARVYRRLNLQRLTDLQRAVDAARPGTPDIASILRALIATSIRWSLDPASPYGVFQYLNHLTGLTDQSDALRVIVHDVDHHMTFVHYLHLAAPWFTEDQIRWRLTAALGVRSQFTRQPERSEVLVGQRLGDPETIIDMACEMIAGMFQRPAGAVPQTRTQTPARARARRISNSV